MNYLSIRLRRSKLARECGLTRIFSGAKTEWQGDAPFAKLMRADHERNKLMQTNERVNSPTVLTFELRDDGRIPNSKLPLLIYPKAVKLSSRDPASTFE